MAYESFEHFEQSFEQLKSFEHSFEHCYFYASKFY